MIKKHALKLMKNFSDSLKSKHVSKFEIHIESLILSVRCFYGFGL